MGFLSYIKEHMLVSIINAVSVIASFLTIVQSIAQSPLDKASGTNLKSIFKQKILRNRVFLVFIAIFIISLFYLLIGYLNNSSESNTDSVSLTTSTSDSGDTSTAPSSNTVITIQDGGTGFINNGGVNTINNGGTTSTLPTVTDVFLDINEYELYPKQSIKLTATVVFSDNTKETSDDNESSFIWFSSNDSVADVDNKGNVTAKSPGKAIIKVQASKNNIADNDSCTITVKEDTTKENSDALSEKAKTLSSTSHTTTSTTATGGSIIITKKDSSTTATDATPTLVTVTNVSLDITEVELTPYQSVKLTATTMFSDNTKETSNDNESNYLWSSSNASVAEVDNKGNVTALSSGTVKITVQASKNNVSKSDTCLVTVKEPVSPPSGYSISLSTSRTTLYSHFTVMIEPYEKDYTEILVHAKAPSGAIFTYPLDSSQGRYFIDTETGVWTIYATIINEAGRYNAHNSQDYATIEIDPLIDSQYIDDILNLS